MSQQSRGTQGSSGDLGGKENLGLSGERSLRSRRCPLRGDRMRDGGLGAPAAAILASGRRGGGDASPALPGLHVPVKKRSGGHPHFLGGCLVQGAYLELMVTAGFTSKLRLLEAELWKTCAAGRRALQAGGTMGSSHLGQGPWVVVPPHPSAPTSTRCRTSKSVGLSPVPLLEDPATPEGPVWD